MIPARRAGPVWLAVAAIVATPYAQAETLPKPGLVVEWRQSADFGGPVTVRQEIAAVTGTIVAHRETTQGSGAPPTQFETWRGLVLTKRHVPPSPAFTESTIAYTLDLPALEKLLPLTAGHRARIEVKGRTASRLGTAPTAPFLTGDLIGNLTVLIERREAVIVPAGRFDAIVIRHEVTLEQPGMDNRTTVAARIWFAPALGWPVKKQQLDAKGAATAEAVAIRVTQPR
jgi:hypothetical protein